jgi:hypothetical protein
MERIKLITGKRTQIELADFFGIRHRPFPTPSGAVKFPPVGWSF